MTGAERQQRLAMSQAHELGQDRMTQLQQWVDGMSYDERCAVSAMISKRNDPFAALPTELVIEVLSHLPISEAWRLQPVGRRWHSLLSSERILRVSLARFDTHDPIDSAMTTSRTATESIRTKVRHMQAVRLGCPFSKNDYTCELPPKYDLRQIIALKGCRMAYIANSNSVTVEDLVTGDHFSFQGDARESIHRLALGSDMVAFATHTGKLYAADLSQRDGLLGRVRLPSAAVLAMHVDQKHIGLLLNRGSTVALHDVETGSLRCFDVAFDPQSGRHVSLLVDCRAGTVDVFNYMQTKLGDGEVCPDLGTEADCIVHMEWRHTRYTLTGQHIKTSHVRLPQRHLPHLVHYNASGQRLSEPDYCTPSPSGNAGLYSIGNAVIWPFCPNSITFGDDTTPLDDSNCPRQIRFDSTKGALRSDCVGGLGEFHALEYQQENEMTVWKDTHLTTKGWLSNNGVLETRNSVDGISRLRSQMEFHAGRWKGHAIVAVNDSFLVTMGVMREQSDVGEISVYCFDEDAKYPGFYSKKIWGCGNGRLLIFEKSSDPEGHLEPLWEHRLRCK